MNEDSKRQLEFIRFCRTRNLRNGLLIGAVVFPVQLLIPTPILSYIAIPVGLLGLALYTYSVTKTARVKCPQCGYGFGSDAFIALGHGSNHCQKCGLFIFADRVPPESQENEWNK